MNTENQLPLSRTILAAGLAVVGTFTSFAFTTAPAQAAELDRASLAAPVAELRQQVLGTAL